MKRVRALVALGCAAGLALTVVTGVAYGEDGAVDSGSEPGRSVQDWDDRRAPQRIGVREAVDKTLGYTRRSVRLRFPGAEYVKPHFSRLLLLPGDEVTVSDPAGREVHTYTSRTEGLWSTSIVGDTAVVTLRSQAEEVTGVPVPDLTRYGVVIDEVAHGLTADDPPPAGPGAEESTCGRDDKRNAACYESDHPAEYRHSRPVARLLIGGTSLCTAWRIGKRNRLLTNHHCFATTAQARDTEVWFDYECRDCMGTQVKETTKVNGAEVLATDRRLDYTLFSVDDFGAIRDFGHLTLANRRAGRGEKVYVPQHPGGDPKKIALFSDRSSWGRGACRIEHPRYDGYDSGTDSSYYCDTEAGSSGSPVLSRRDDKVVALHHFGGCPNSGVRADLLYRAINGYL